MLGEFSALNEILESYIQELGVVNVQTEGRITIKEEPESEPEPAEETQPVPVEPEEDAKEQVAAASQDVYVVKPNDVLWKIAQRFGLTWQRLAEYNRLANPHLIFPGQEILIPAN
jgi:5'-nucleotidase